MRFKLSSRQELLANTMNRLSSADEPSDYWRRFSRAGMLCGFVIFLSVGITELPSLLEPVSSVVTSVKQSFGIRTYDRDSTRHIEVRKSSGHWSEKEIRMMATRIAENNALPPQLIHAVIEVESRYDIFAESPKGALGLMQLMPQTAEEFGVENPYNPQQNILAGTRYLKYLIDEFNGDNELALAAYNAGPATVRKYGGIPPYPETKRYVNKVRYLYQKSVGRKSADQLPSDISTARSEKKLTPADILKARQSCTQLSPRC